MVSMAPDRVGSSKPATCRMFETPLIERFSRIHPATPFVFWIPVYSYLAFRAYENGVGLGVGLSLGLLGLFAWTFAEYVLHRWVFHYVGPKLWQRRVHFVLHGVHHDFPQDADRLVFPLGASIPLGVAFYLLFRAIVGPVLADPLFAGFGSGYLVYDGTHYAIHHFRMSSRWGKWIKRHHMIHHHTGTPARWGVSSPLWDYVFGTMKSS
ncbi:sterol desaturase family protein [Polyangium sp. 6x1]|uniref:sterol desaturase family protein n=1 Tax=Polyangium sp. 6x1 TaxID=3042689 RepID=UPI002482B5E1|nr:sterol desaturase family protein [Polyangium sp. 6x1]MDI1444753.1 sterol desaturase family protein [Polyangium sp. 6x1]